MDETLVTQTLPESGTRVLAFGHKTYCCSEDMDKEPAWHECTFKMEICSYGLKSEVPTDPEESILRCYEVQESWEIEEVEYGAREHLLLVTKWKKIQEHEPKDFTHATDAVRQCTVGNDSLNDCILDRHHELKAILPDLLADIEKENKRKC